MPKKLFSKIFTMIKWVFVPLLRLKVSPPVVIPQSYCDVHLLRSPWLVPCLQWKKTRILKGVVPFLEVKCAFLVIFEKISHSEPPLRCSSKHVPPANWKYLPTVKNAAAKPYYKLSLDAQDLSQTIKYFIMIQGPRRIWARQDPNFFMGCL